MLGMSERQTQIWFQNRRAKAKLLDGKLDQDSMELPPDMPPELAAGWDTDLQLLIHEDDEHITIIPCQELTVGSWRRLASTVTKYDLVAYICHGRKTLSWFIHASGCGFKMEIPFDTVIDTKFTNSTPGMGQASFILSRPPAFFMEHADGLPSSSGIPARVWRPSADWTEKKQASKVLRHDLVGAAIQLAHVLRTISAAKAGPSIPLYPVLYDPSHPATRQASSFAPGASRGTMNDLGGPPQPQSSTGRRFSRAPSMRHQDSSLELVGRSSLPTVSSRPYSLRGAGSPPLPSPAYSLDHPNFPVPSGSAVLYSDHRTTPSPLPASPEHFLNMEVPISISRRSFSGTSTAAGIQQADNLGGGGGGGDDMSLPPSISHSGRRHSSFTEGSVHTLTQAMSSLGSHPPSAWGPSDINIPPAPPYLLSREPFASGSTSSSPHLNFSTPQDYPPEYQQNFPQG